MTTFAIAALLVLAGIGITNESLGAAAAVSAAIIQFPMPFIYILQCRDGSLYTGIAKDVARRLREHGAGRASRYTRARLPVRLVWSRRVRSWGFALREEYRIKYLPRAAKLALVRSGVRSARRGR